MTLFKMTAVVIALSLGLSACAQITEQRNKRNAARASADRSECITMGFEVGTDAFRLCLDNRNILRQTKAAQRAAEDAERAARDAEDAADGY